MTTRLSNFGKRFHFTQNMNRRVSLASRKDILISKEMASLEKTCESVSKTVSTNEGKIMHY